MNKTFIDMLTAINEPEAIERAYQIMAAKRDLLAYDRNKVKTREFAHTYMEPKPLTTKPKHMVTAEGSSIPKRPPLQLPAFKLMPSLADIMRTRTVKGEHLIRLKDVTHDMKQRGFQNGMVFKLLKGGYDKSSLRHVRSGRVAIISNVFLESFFKPTHPSQLPVENTDF